MGAGSSRKRSKSVVEVPPSLTANAPPKRTVSAGPRPDLTMRQAGPEATPGEPAIMRDPGEFADTYRSCVRAVAAVADDAGDRDEERRLALDALEMLYERVLESLRASSGHGVELPTDGQHGAYEAAVAEAGECMVCMDEVDEWRRMVNCRHVPSCSECLRGFVAGRVEAGEVTPWVCCAQADCNMLLHPQDIAHALPTAELLRFVTVFMRKHLSRERGWIECSTDGCAHGLLLYTATEAHVEDESTPCPACGTAFTAKAVDDEIQKLVDAGTLRPCPVCDHLTMKDYGMCNIMQCERCGIWWNWRSREHGRDGRQLKQRSRQNGTMWEPGELEYQRNLERSDPEQFKALLERNGIKYDPKYKRGTG